MLNDSVLSVVKLKKKNIVAFYENEYPNAPFSILSGVEFVRLLWAFSLFSAAKCKSTADIRITHIFSFPCFLRADQEAVSRFAAYYE